MDRNAEALAAARRWIGTPYRHGQAARGAGCDCLGLLRGVWAELYGPAPRPGPYPQRFVDAAAYEARLRDACERYLARRKGPAQAGDVALIAMRRTRPATHLGILSGPETIVHAYSGHAVREDRLHPAWAVRGLWAWPARFDRAEG